MIVLPAGVVEYLMKKFGERFYKALINYNPENVTRLAVTKNDLEISAAVSSDDKQYACYFGKDRILCTCKDQMTRKMVCKHLFSMLLKALEEGLVELRDILEPLIMFPVSSKTGKEE